MIARTNGRPKVCGLRRGSRPTPARRTVGARRSAGAVSRPPCRRCTSAVDGPYDGLLVVGREIDERHAAPGGCPRHWLCWLYWLYRLPLPGAGVFLRARRVAWQPRLAKIRKALLRCDRPMSVRGPVDRHRMRCLTARRPPCRRCTKLHAGAGLPDPKLSSASQIRRGRKSVSSTLFARRD